VEMTRGLKAVRNEDLRMLAGKRGNEGHHVRGIQGVSRGGGERKINKNAGDKSA